jgi:Holliday junction resolvase RusA-like endonuclease
MEYPNMNLKFGVSYQLPSQNVELRKHWGTRRREKKRLAWELLAIKCEMEIEIPTRKKHLQLTSIRKNLCDEDNVMLSPKTLIDAMRAVGILYKDDPSWLSVGKIKQRRRRPGEPAHTLVEITDAQGSLLNKEDL